MPNLNESRDGPGICSTKHQSDILAMVLRNDNTLAPPTTGVVYMETVGRYADKIRERLLHI